MKGKLDYCIRVANQEPSFNLNLTHNGAEPIVWHESILDEYWNRLEAKIQLGLVTNICKIQIVNVEIKKERLAAYSNHCPEGRANFSNTRVDFHNANLCVKRASYLFRSWWTLVRHCRHSAFTTIGLIT